MTYMVYWTNHEYYAQDVFSTFEQALEYGKSKCFEFSIIKPYTDRKAIGEQVAFWSPIGGLRDYRTR